MHAVNQPGFGHIAFAVMDVHDAREAVIAAGGTQVGEVVTLVLTTKAAVTWCYVRDPEGNMIELQADAAYVQSSEAANHRTFAGRRTHLEEPGTNRETRRNVRIACCYLKRPKPERFVDIKKLVYI